MCAASLSNTSLTRTTSGSSPSSARLRSPCATWSGLCNESACKGLCNESALLSFCEQTRKICKTERRSHTPTVGPPPVQLRPGARKSVWTCVFARSVGDWRQCMGEPTAQVGISEFFQKKRTAKPGTKTSEFVARFRTKPGAHFRTRSNSWTSQPER